MLLRTLAIAVSVLLGALLSGCACPSAQCLPGTPHAPCCHDLTLADGDPPEILVASEYELLPLPAPTETYSLLDAPTCQCHAATNSTIANLVELERHWAKIVIECDTENVRENLCLDRDLLALHAYDDRNTSAGLALESFYQLAGLEAQRHYLEMGIDETGKTLGRLDRLREQGLALPPGLDRTAVATRLGRLQSKKLEMEFLRIQLNGQLQKLTGCPLDEYTFFWPHTDWQPDLTPLDVEGELAEGLATRSDLRGLSLVLCKLTKTTLPIARGVLKFADSTLGTIEPREGWIHVARCFRCNKFEVAVRCRQLAMFYNHSEQGAIAEIKGIAYRVALLQRQIVLAQQKVDDLEQRLEELNKTRDTHDVTVFEISQARGQLYEAESELIEQVTALRIARVQLRKAQGILARECGFEPVLCCEGCCDGDCCQCQTTCQCRQAGGCRSAGSCCE